MAIKRRFGPYPRVVVNLTAKDVLYAFSSLFSSRLDGGSEIPEFERQFARKVGCAEAVAVSSARFALALILQEKGLKPGDEVILPSYIYHAVPNILVAMKLKPVFTDVYEKDSNINPDLIESRVTARTKALIPAHLDGQPADMGAIREIAETHSLFIIEDCAQATGAEYHRKPVGSIGDASIFSLALGKTFGGTGGGLITTQDVELADRIRARIAGFTPHSRLSIFKSLMSTTHLWLSSHPTTFRYTTYPMMRLSRKLGIDVVDVILSHTRRRQKRMAYVPESMRKRFLNLNARILMEQLQSLDERNEKRIALADIYNETFEELGSISIPRLSHQNKNIYTGYSVMAVHSNPRRLQKYLIQKGIDTGQRIMSVCSDLEIFKEFHTDCPVAKKLFKHSIRLPINHHMDEEDARYIAETLSKAVHRAC